MLILPAGLVIPLIGPDGSVIRLRFRTNLTGKRYVVAAGSSMAPLMIGCDRPGKPIVVVESELDAYLLAQVAFDLVSIAATGSAQMVPTPELDSTIRAAPLLICILDFDEAGDAAALKWQET